MTPALETGRDTFHRAPEFSPIGAAVEGLPSRQTPPDQTAHKVPPAQPPPLKIAIVGHVDHGKSTLVGRLLHDTGSLPEDKVAQLEQIARNHGVGFEWANLMDALQSERDQNITIDTAPIGFRSRLRPYLLIDTPGHKEFLKNMVTGAAHADAALLLIDAHEGVQENSRRHGYLLHFLGIRQLAVLVNKMDREDYREERFLQIVQEYGAWLKSVGVEPKVFIPVAARHGDNLSRRSPNMPWWQGPTVLEALDGFSVPEAPQNQPLRFPIQDVYRFDERRILVGRVESGSLKVGDQLLFSPTDKTSRVKTIERWQAPVSDTASAGESIGITLTEQIFVPRGAIGTLETSPPLELASFKARLFWLGKAPFAKGKAYKLKLATQEVECHLEAVEQVIDASTLTPLPRLAGEVFVARHEVAEVRLHTKKPLAFDVHAELPATGRFVIVDEFEVAGGGIVLEHNYPRRAHGARLRSQNIFWSQAKITQAQREARNGHPGCVLWLTGLPSSGKSTIAIELEHQLFELGWQVNVLDGDNIRHGLGSDLGFSPRDRTENIRRVGEVAKLFAESGFVCITAFVSPYRADRDLVRQMLPPGRFIEVFVNAPLAVCEQRDPKGLYAKARAREIKEFTGISAPYEVPLRAEMELRTDQLTVAESAALILEYLSALPAK